MTTVQRAKSTSARAARAQVIRASAGTGKTFQLTNCLLRLLLLGASPGTILATTFTRKAAGEILDRVLERLSKATASDEAASGLCKELSLSGGTVKATRAQLVELLAKLVRRIDQLRISTLDSYFQKAAQTYSFELGLPFGWDVLNEDQYSQVQNEAIRRVLKESSPGEIVNLMHLLDQGNLSWKVASQIRATVEAARAVYLQCAEGAWKKIEPRKGLDEHNLREAIAALEALSPPNGNGHYKNELTKAINKATNGEFAYFIESGVGKAIVQGAEKFQKLDIPAEWREVYARLVEHAAAEELKWLAIRNEATADLIGQFETQHQIAKRQRRQYAFDDIPRKLAQSLHSAASHERLAFRLDAGIEHLLLDEFQDTSAEQWRVLAPTARRVCEERKGDFLCVGDVKQAIYGWRGGSAKIFAAIESQLRGVRVEHLTQSYRSSPPVIAAVNQVMEKLGDYASGNAGREKSKEKKENKDLAGLKAWAKDFLTHATAKSELPGWVTLREVAPSEEAGSANKAKLLAALEKAAEIAEEAHEAAPGRSIAILLRRNEPVGRMVHLLRQRGIEASEEGGASLLDSAAVETILSLLQLADHPGDTVARFHLETGPLAKELLASLALPAAFAAELRRELVEKGYGAFARKWGKKLAPYCDARDAGRLEQLVEIASEYNRDATLRPGDFARFVQKKKVSDVAPAVVRVMTIHQSKGLEFDTVILPELEVKFRGREPKCVAGGEHFLEPATRATRWVDEALRPLIPAALQADHDADRDNRVQESLCMLYVAMTRAIHALHLIIPEGKSSGTWADLLRTTLAGNEKTEAEEKLLFEIGDLNWHRKLKGSASAAISPPKEVDWPTIAFKPPSAAATRNLPRQKPSVAAHERVFNPYAAFSPKTTDATRFGTAIHYWFEQMTWLDSAETLDLTGDLAAKGIALPTDDVAAWRKRFEEYRKLAYLHEFFEEKAFRKRFGASGALSVENETSIVFRDEGSLITGQIDRLVFEKQGDRLVRAWIIDFKTDAIEKGSKAALAERTAHHSTQLLAYVRGVAKNYRLPETAVEAYLVMLEAGEVVRVASG